MSQSSLGQFLRSEREKRGITIEQVASATKISVRLLHGLEADHYADLPAKPFIRGFVISYCRFIGLDAKDVLARYGGFLEERSRDRPSKDTGHSGYAFDRKDSQRSRTYLWVMMGSFVVLGGVVMFVLKPALRHRRVSYVDQLRAAHAQKETVKTIPVAAKPLKKFEELSDEQKKQVETAHEAAAQFLKEKEYSKSLDEIKKLAALTAEYKDSKEIEKLAKAELEKQKESEEKPSPESEKTAQTEEEKKEIAEEKKPEPEQKEEEKEKEKEEVAEEKSEDEESEEKEVAGESVEPGRVPSIQDPLNKGDSLKAANIQHKVVFKALADAWIRYRVDSKPVMRFILKKDQLLVLRAGTAIRFQVSNPDSIRFRYNNGTYRLFSSEKFVLKHNETPTLFFPKQVSENTGEPFPGQRPLPATPSPDQGAAATSAQTNT